MDDLFDDPEFIELIKLYIQSLKDSIPEIRSNLSADVFDPIQKFGHNIKGSGGGYGFNELSELGRNLEIAAKAADSKNCEKNINEIERFILNLN